MQIYTLYLDVPLTHLFRPNSKTKSSASNNHTSKKQPPETLLEASTITSKAQPAGRVSAPRVWV
jgi:hypothetical protein